MEGLKEKVGREGTWGGQSKEGDGQGNGRVVTETF